MKKAMIEHVKSEKFDNYYTPDYAVYPLLEFLPPTPLIVWECCDPGRSKITYVLKEKGYNVISTDITTGFNFLEDKPNFKFDMLVTNPPYSLKNEFLKKCYEYNKPFALLLPITTLEGIERGKMFREKGISVIVLDKRVNFIKNYEEAGRKNGCWFNTSWFMWKLDEGNKLYFWELSNKK